MKVKNILLGALLLASGAAYGQVKFSVSGSVSGLSDTDTIDVYEVGHHFSTPFQSLPVKAGQFSFSGNFAEPRGVLLVVRNASGSYPMILDGENIRLSGAISKSGSNDRKDIDWKLAVSGSPLTAEYYRKMQVKDSLNAAYDAYHARYAAAKARIATETKNEKDTALVAARYKAAYDQMAKEEKEFFTGVETAYARLFEQNKTTWWGPFFMEHLMSYFTPDARPTYEQFSAAAKQSYYGKMVADELYPKDLTGKSVPDFTINVGGKPQTLRQLLQGKKYALIDFWASWCVPCRREIPNLKKLYAQYASKGFQIISISIDKKPAQWQAAMKQEQMPWVSVLDTTGIADKYKVVAIPATFLVDANGHLIADAMTGEKLATKLAELLK